MLGKPSENLIKDGVEFEILSKIQSFPATRYYGSKKRLLPWIYENTKDLAFSTVLDVFGGTASTSLLFQAMGKKVTFNDGLKSNQIMASVLLQQKKITVSKEEFVHFINEVVPEKGFISNNFKNAYYTDQENNWLDGIAIKIHSLKNKEQQAVYFYCLFQACLQKRPFNLFHRENLNLRLKNVKRSFGNLKTWNTEFTTLMLRSYVQLNINSKGKKIKACVKPATDALKVKGKYDLVYLDPPYVDKKANSDTYLKKYHFLEGLSSYYEWDEKLVNCGSRYNHDNINMELAKNKVLFESYLFKLIKKYKGSIVVLSYMSEAYPSKEVFEQVFKKMFLSVKVIEKEFSHVLAKSKRNEFLIIGIPNDK